MDERHIYTVSELTQNIKFLLEDTFGYVWVEGEISNLRSPGSGHLYFTLKDSLSELRAVMFKNSHLNLKFDLQDGLKVVCYGRITVYERRGEYQILVEYIEPKGLGALMLALEQLKKKLAKEGLFDLRYKKEIPFLPQRIGIVTSLSGAAIRDMLKVLRRRFYNLHILIYPVRVQGEFAAQEIAQAIEHFNQLDEKVDVLIVGRGGGSIEDLWAFNEEVVARAIFSSQIPVVSAVGHERDWTISDWVADLRAPTPSAAAELVVKTKEELEQNLSLSKRRIKNALLSLLDRKKQLLDSLAGRYGLFRIKDLIPQKAQRIDELLERMNLRIKELKRSREEKLKNLLQHLENLNPLSILSRGYSLTIDKRGKLVRESSQLEVGEKVRTRLHQGSFISRVEKIESS